MTPESEQQGYLEKSRRFLASARLLLAHGDIDSAVSRAYYAAFFVAEALLESTGEVFSSHKAAIAAYGKHFAKTARLDPRFHRLLITAFQKRQQADYLVKTGLGSAEVDELIAETAAFLAAAETWLAQRPPSV
jgi:uncharacterized protein (UPF0332 family)